MITQPPAEDLFTSAVSTQKDERAITLTVAGLTKQIRDLLETTFLDVTVEGEISNFLHHRSGHRYWTLKDQDAQISCVFWKSRSASFDIASGQHIVCRGRLTVYPPRGNYQLDVFQVRPVGVGALQLAFEKLFASLKAEGLFDESRKRLLPKFPKRIGIVTSATGAAIHDILTVLRRRYPIADVLLRPAAVQGVGSELQVAQAIREFNSLPAADRPDVLIVGRGGGSLEDLWTFNEEAVARAIFASAIPVVSAVGHEVDVTIADFVADLRAPTPTAAAELITPDRNELVRTITGFASAIQDQTSTQLSSLRSELVSHSAGYGLKYVLSRALEDRITDVTRMASSAKLQADRAVELAILRLDRDRSTLRALDPKGVLERGYAILQRPDGAVVTQPEQLAVDGEATAHIHGGSIRIRRI
ncbi:MAG: exodeoxyribonuclease VII large subunit [Bacteroidetes bacterium]|nr:exodeoxyribonuclease VII large subunit [Bacteroidota bacterium]